MLVLALLFLFIHIDNSRADTDPSNENYRIRYGKPVSENKKIPYLVGLLKYFELPLKEESLTWVCAGTLVSKYYVLIADHCVEDGFESVAYVVHREGFQPFDWKLNVKYKVAYFVSHIKSVDHEIYNIAMIRTEWPIENLLDTDFSILNNVPVSDFGKNYNLKLYGGGRIEDDTDTVHLREMYIELHESQDLSCQFRDLVFCYKGLRYGSSTNPASTNAGDGGSPIVYTKEDEAGVMQTYLVGIHTSKIINTTSTEKIETVEIAMNIKHFIPWINLIVHKLPFKFADQVPPRGVFHCCDGPESD